MADTTGRIYGSTANNGSNVLYGTKTYGDAYSPGVVISSTSISNDGYINTGTAQNFVATFTEIDIVNFVVGDITIVNGSPTNFAGPTTVGGVDVFTFDVAPLAEGLVSVSVGAGVANDFNSNPNTASNTYTFTYETVAPYVTNITSSTANGSYGPGNTILVQVTFNENVHVVGGPPQLALNVGSSYNINYTSGTGTTTLTFTYVVQVGHISSDLDYFSTTALTLNGGTIKDTAGNSAILTLPAPGASGSLSVNKNLEITNGWVSGTISGTRANETWVGTITLSGNVIIPNGVTVTVDLNTIIHSFGYVIIVQDGGMLNTQGRRLPRNSAISGFLYIT